MNDYMKMIDKFGVKPPANKSAPFVAVFAGTLVGVGLLAVRGASFMAVTALAAPYVSVLSPVSFWTSTAIVFLLGFVRGLRLRGSVTA